MVIKKWLAACFSFIFVVISVIFISSEPAGNETLKPDSKASIKFVQEENKKITELVDEDGNLVVSPKLGYAVESITKTKTGELEEYFDDHNKQVTTKTGYHSIKREYDKNGHINRIIYQNADGMPVTGPSGYAIEERVCSDEGLILSVRYYDANGKPARTANSGYGKDNVYDENGKSIKITYVDAEGKPLRTRLEYAIMTRTYYENGAYEKGKIKDEYYFDENGEPVSLSNGAYGAHRDYNEKDQTTILTYVDKDGNPIVTSSGYTTIIRSKYVSDTEYTERYFDINGEPVALSEGQYGTKRYNGKTVYLDRNGNEIFNMKNFLHNHSRIVIILAFIVIIVSSLTGRKENFILLAVYIAIIGYLTLMFRETGNYSAIHEILWQYRHIFHDAGARADIIKNIWLFIPLGAILYRLWPRKAIILFPIILSIIIEGIQYFTGTGFCELDDVISNSLGGCIGFYSGKLTTDLKLRIKKRKHIDSV